MKEAIERRDGATYSSKRDALVFVMDNEGWNLDFIQGHFRNRTGPLVGKDG